MANEDPMIAALEDERDGYLRQGRQSRADECQEQIDLLRGIPRKPKAAAKKAAPTSRKEPGVERAVKHK